MAIRSKPALIVNSIFENLPQSRQRWAWAPCFEAGRIGREPNAVEWINSLSGEPNVKRLPGGQTRQVGLKVGKG